MSRSWRSRYAAFLLLATMAGCWRLRTPVQAPSDTNLPPSAPEASPAESPSPEASPSPLFTEDTEASSSRIPIAAGPRKELFYYDPRVVDMLAVPGAGQDIGDPIFFDDDRRISFDQDGKIFVWDRYLDMKEVPQGVDDIPNVSDPTWDASDSIMAFHNPESAYLFVRFDARGYLMQLAGARSSPATTAESPSPTRSPSPGQSAAPLAPSPAETAGPARSSNPAGSLGSAVAPGRTVSAATSQTRGESNPISSPPSPAGSPSPAPSESPAPQASETPARALPENALSSVWLQGEVVSLAKIAAVGALEGGITDTNIDDAASEVAFITGAGNLYIYWLRTGTLDRVVVANTVGDHHVESLALAPQGTLVVFRSGPRLYLYRLPTNDIDPMPTANAAYNAIGAHDAVWISSREFYYRLDLSDGRTLFARYNWLTETVRAAFFFNNVRGDGFHALSNFVTLGGAN